MSQKLAARIHLCHFTGENAARAGHNASFFSLSICPPARPPLIGQLWKVSQSDDGSLRSATQARVAFHPHLRAAPHPPNAASSLSWSAIVARHSCKQKRTAVTSLQVSCRMWKIKNNIASRPTKHPSWIRVTEEQWSKYHISPAQFGQAYLLPLLLFQTLCNLQQIK